MKDAKKLTILHAPTTVGGNAPRISAAEKQLGFSSKTLTITQNYFNYPVDFILSSESAKFLPLRRIFWFILNFHKFDVIHYNFGTSIFPGRVNSARYSWVLKVMNFFLGFTEYLDIRIAKLFSKRVTITFQGDDARQGDFCKENYIIHFANEVSTDYYTKFSDELKRSKIHKLENLVEEIYAVNPDLLRVLPKKAKFIPYAGVDLNQWKFIGPDISKDKIHVVHAPSNRVVKGSKYILEAFERLKSEGYPLEFTLVEGLSNEKARDIYEKCDLLVDQMLAGFYGGLSVELMSLGKPCICYLRKEDLSKIPKEMAEDLPIINSSPQEIYDTLKFYLTIGRPQLYEIGKRSRKYVERWHSPIKIARFLNGLDESL